MGAFFLLKPSVCRLTVCPRWAGAFEVVDEVYTGSSMEARLRVAFINIILTVHTLEAWFTLQQRRTVQMLAHLAF